MVQILHRRTGEVIFEIETADLSGLGSSDKRFVGADLSGASLKGNTLFYGDFSGANFEGADLSGADLSLATFNETNLRGADLTGATVYGTDFNTANLTNSVLVGIKFWLASFEGARFDGADLAETSLLECTGLKNARGLDRVRRFVSSGLDRQTLVNNFSGLPEGFLLRAGYTTLEIETFRSLYQSGNEMLSCFVSHAEADLEFATKVILDLRRNNVQCWHYKENLRGGKSWRQQIRSAISSHDRLLLICSRRSLYRPNVVEEILDALDDQRLTGKQKLFPIRLDDHILSSCFMEEAREKVVTQQWKDNWVPEVVSNHIPDFSSWSSDPVTYGLELARLLESLRVSAQK